MVIDDPLVSRFHCRIERGARAWRLIDQDSLNGTRMSGVVIRDCDLPLPECRLEIGDSVIVVTEEQSIARIELLDQASYGDLYGVSLPMRRLFATLERVCASGSNVLVEGASGTGKELVAMEIVKRGARRRQPFVIVDCSAIAPSVLESELFGHVRGAFTGADRDRVGAFEAAEGGTIFLDEIGELPLEMQPKLLRALEAHEIRRVGETKSRKIGTHLAGAAQHGAYRFVEHVGARHVGLGERGRRRRSGGAFLARRSVKRRARRASRSVRRRAHPVTCAEAESRTHRPASRRCGGAPSLR